MSEFRLLPETAVPGLTGGYRRMTAHPEIIHLADKRWIFKRPFRGGESRQLAPGPIVGDHSIRETLPLHISHNAFWGQRTTGDYAFKWFPRSQRFSLIAVRLVVVRVQY
jgi:hypothetical protein